MAPFFTYKKNLQNLPRVGFEPTPKTVNIGQVDCSTNWAIGTSKSKWWCNFNQSKSNQTQLNPSNLNLTSRTEWMNSYLGDIFRQSLVISSVCVVAINIKFFEAFIILVVFFWSNWCKSHFLYSHFRRLWCPMLALQVWNKS